VPTSPTTIVLDEVTTWGRITTTPTPRGATAILFDGHELGHVHATRGTLDLPLPADRRAPPFWPPMRMNMPLPRLVVAMAGRHCSASHWSTVV
jgi:hypothetical protein